MKLVYIAGPYKAETVWLIEQNIRRAEEWGHRVAEIGAMPVVPHIITRFFHGSFPEEFWLEGTRDLLARCDAILLIPGWEHSHGTRGELDEANLRRIPAFYDIGTLRHWLEQFIELAAVAR